MNYEELNKISLNLIDICPFIEKKRKDELKLIYKKFYDIWIYSNYKNLTIDDF